MKVAVHDGVFHADDVLTVCIINIAFNTECEIIRSRNPEELETADIIADVGNVYDGVRYFDHHQSTSPYHEGTSIKCASLGLVFEAFYDRIAKKYLSDGNSKKFHDLVVNDLILGLDSVDNGQAETDSRSIKYHDFSSVVKGMNTPNARDSELQLNAFKTCVRFFQSWLDQYFQNTAQCIIDTDVIDDAVKDCKNGVLVLPRFMISWKDRVLDKGYNHVKVALIEQAPGQWSITSALKIKGSQECRCPAPKELRSTKDSDNKTLGNCPIVFIHTSGFTGSIKAQSLEEAVKAAEIWVSESESEKY